MLDKRAKILLKNSHRKVKLKQPILLEQKKQKKIQVKIKKIPNPKNRLKVKLLIS